MSKIWVWMVNLFLINSISQPKIKLFSSRFGPMPTRRQILQTALRVSDCRMGQGETIDCTWQTLDDVIFSQSIVEHSTQINHIPTGKIWKVDSAPPEICFRKGLHKPICRIYWDTLVYLKQKQRDPRALSLTYLKVSAVPWSKVAILGIVIPPFNRNPYNGYINPYYWVDDHPLLYGNNGSLDLGTAEVWTFFLHGELWFWTLDFVSFRWVFDPFKFELQNHLFFIRRQIGFFEPSLYFGLHWYFFQEISCSISTSAY